MIYMEAATWLSPNAFFVVSNNAFGNAFLSLAVKVPPLTTNEGFAHEDSMRL